MIRLFISHSSEDVELVALLVQLITTALRLRSQDIRCTSLDGYRLHGGADVDEQLRDEALAADAFIGVVSTHGMSSAYVLFELGARWGAKKRLIPLLAPSVKPHALAGPLRGLHALSSDSMAELHQLLAELAQALNESVEPPAVCQRYLDAIVYHVTTSESPTEATVTPSRKAVDKPKSRREAAQDAINDEYAGAEAVIAQHCEREWPDDYNMRSYCVTQQRTAVDKLRNAPTTGIPSDVFMQIRRKCAREWPDDYAMRQYCEDQQLVAYRRLHPT